MSNLEQAVYVKTCLIQSCHVDVVPFRASLWGSNLLHFVQNHPAPPRISARSEDVEKWGQDGTSCQSVRFHLGSLLLHTSPSYKCPKNVSPSSRLLNPARRESSLACKASSQRWRKATKVATRSKSFADYLAIIESMHSNSRALVIAIATLQGTVFPDLWRKWSSFS